MKRIIYALLAISVGFAACQKESKIAPISNVASESISDADITASKSSIGENKKAPGNTLDIDYNIALKKKNTYGYEGMRIIRLRANTLQGANIGDKDDDFLLPDAVSNIVISINNTKYGAETPLDIVLKSDGLNGKAFNFPAFTYKDDLEYEMVTVKASFKLKDGSIKVIDKSTFSFIGSTITVTSGDLQLGSNSSFKLPAGSSVIVDGVKLKTSFAILFGGIGKESSCEDESDFIFLPNGHTVEQDPTVKRVSFPKIDGGKVMRVTITGDPEQTIEAILYTPPPMPDPAKPGNTIQPPVIKLQPSVVHKKTGVVSYDSGFISGESNAKPGDFNSYGQGWARLTLLSAL